MNGNAASIDIIRTILSSRHIWASGEWVETPPIASNCLTHSSIMVQMASTSWWYLRFWE